MSKYLVTLTNREFNTSSSGYMFRGETNGSSKGHIKIETQICEFEHEYPTEAEINKIAKYHPIVKRRDYTLGGYYEYSILFMQKLEDEE